MAAGGVRDSITIGFRPLPAGWGEQFFHLSKVAVEGRAAFAACLHEQAE